MASLIELPRYCIINWLTPVLTTLIGPHRYRIMATLIELPWYCIMATLIDLPWYWGWIIFYLCLVVANRACPHPVVHVEDRKWGNSVLWWSIVATSIGRLWELQNTPKMHMRVVFRGDESPIVVATGHLETGICPVLRHPRSKGLVMYDSPRLAPKTHTHIHTHTRTSVK